MVVGDRQVVLGNDRLQVANPLADDGGLNAGAGVVRLGNRVRAWGDVMRVLVVVLLVGIGGCSGEDNSPSDVAALKKLGAAIK